MNKTDVDRPSTWRLFKPGLCESCRGSCCTMPVEVRLPDLIRLQLVSEDEAAGSIKKLAKRLMREGYITSYRAGTEFFMLSQKANRDCVFLDSVSRLCTVYFLRPSTCREFPQVGPRPPHCPYTAR